MIILPCGHWCWQATFFNSPSNFLALGSGPTHQKASRALASGPASSIQTAEPPESKVHPQVGQHTTSGTPRALQPETPGHSSTYHWDGSSPTRGQELGQRRTAHTGGQAPAPGPSGPRLQPPVGRHQLQNHHSHAACHGRTWPIHQQAISTPGIPWVSMASHLMTLPQLLRPVASTPGRVWQPGPGPAMPTRPPRAVSPTQEKDPQGPKWGHQWEHTALVMRGKSATGTQGMSSAKGHCSKVRKYIQHTRNTEIKTS